MQFWEDVEQGLSDIETVYPPSQTQSESQRPNLNSMDRIRTFAQTAQGILPPPLPSAPGHQPSPEHMPGLTAQPFWDITSNAIQFPWASKLEENWHIIRQELDAKLENEARAAALAKQQQQQQTLGGGKNSIFSGDSAWQNNVMGAGWSAFRLQRLGVWNGDNCQQFPQTTELLRSLDIPFAVRGVCFARQQAMSGVQPHSDGRNFILTSHLGLKIPKGCWMKVGEETRGWEEGKLTTLDTSFEHSTGNPSEEDRHVLIIDFWHPELTEVEIKALEFVYDLRNKFESGQVPFRKPRRILEQEKKKKMEQGLGLAGMWNGLFSKK
jgi:Aspartyl/asparaginyl beta-hydroxylase and related dioxygenases